MKILKITKRAVKANEKQMLASLLESGVCYRVSDMKINGDDLRALGFSGRNIGKMLEKMLYMIAEGKIENERKMLLSEVAKYL